MTKLEELIKELCPNGVEYKTIGEIATDIFRGAGIKREDVTEEGLPCVRYGEIYTTYGVWFDTCVSHTTEDKVDSKKYFSHGDILFAITGESVEDIAKCTAYVGHERCLAGGDIVVVKHNQNPKYLSYALSTRDVVIQKGRGKVKSKVVHSSVPSIKELVIPLPPLVVQCEIVRILDDYTEQVKILQCKLQEELDARRKQYEYYRDKLLSFDKLNGGCEVRWLKLKEIGRVCMCKRILKSETSSEGEIPFYKIGTFGKEADAYISRETFDRYKNAYSYPKNGDILISAAGTIGRTVVFDGKPAYFQDSNIVWIDNDETKVLNHYLFYCYSMQPWKASTGGTIQRLYNENIENAKIPVPPLEVQGKIVETLDKFDKLCNDLSEGLPAEIEARQKQYEYYRDKLLSFKECV